MKVRVLKVYSSFTLPNTIIIAIFAKFEELKQGLQNPLSPTKCKLLDSHQMAPTLLPWHLNA
jgi:hypothetical protein